VRKRLNRLAVLRFLDNPVLIVAQKLCAVFGANLAMANGSLFAYNFRILFPKLSL
jgi:hypothetical protein